VSSSTTAKGDYVHVVGNGTDDDNRSNCHTLDWNGNAWFKGKVYVGGTSMNDAVELGSGGSVDLTEYAKKTDIPTNVSSFTNDAGYLTQHQSLNNYYTKTEVDNKIANVGSGGTVDLSSYATKEYVTGLGYQTEAQVLALIQANMPTSGDEVSY
jgi:hypothetical protein